MPWPEIELLDLNTFTGDTRPQVTFVALEAFAAYCPQLRDVSVPLNFTCLPSSLRRSSHRLEKLCVGYQVTGAPHLIARHVNALFPYLKQLRGHDDVGVDDEDEDDDDGAAGSTSDSSDDEDSEEEKPSKWSQISRMLRLCQAVREDFRKSIECRETTIVLRQVYRNCNCWNSRLSLDCTFHSE
jgi:hypothetical protein